MRILFIGDIFGKAGIEMLEATLPELKATYQPNLIIANAENAASGRGITQDQYKTMMTMGIHVLTMGNWVWGNKELFAFLEDANIVRPVNYPDAPGKGYQVLNYNNKRILVINALGRTFMNPNLDCPFTRTSQVLDTVEADVVFIDFHAEATSEKIAFAHVFDGRVDVIVGTHTHVQTADNRRLPKGTLYITDVGMTGPLEGVIGVQKEIVIERFTKGYSTYNKTASGPRQLNAVIIDLVQHTMERIQRFMAHD
ncbi:MAG: TIGR00282 family metallophosphoesterase [Acholeplasmataceae bacterium]|nr:MAG: TIGR00282 family metallophosphoesterase [Acholeplasmataceae bacterium]